MANEKFNDYLVGRGQQFQRYAAGNKRYGPSGSMAPNVGPTSDRAGYAARDARANSLRNAALRKLKANNSNNFASADSLRPLPRTPYSGRAGGY
jgi:hypothetical protein